MSRKLVVISYASADAEAFERLKAAFGAEVEVLTDEGGAGRADWSPAIARALQVCDAFLLLVTPEALDLPFVAQRIEALAERELEGGPPITVAVLLTPTPEASLALIGRAARYPGDGKALSDFSSEDAELWLRRLAEAIAHELLKAPSSAPLVETAESLLAWLRAQKPQVAVALAARAALRALPFYKPLTAFPAAAEAWAAALRLETASEDRAVALAETASAAGAAAAASAAYAAAYAASSDPSVYSSDAAQHAADAVDACVEIIGRALGEAAAGRAWREAGTDVELASRGTAEALAQAPLWSGETPGWARLREELPGEGAEWYADRLAGREGGASAPLAPLAGRVSG